MRLVRRAGMLGVGVLLSASACGSDSAARDAGSTIDSAIVDGATDDLTAAGGADGSCTALPSRALTRNATNPLLRNGPQAYDDSKTGPRVVLKLAANDYRIWYEAVSSSGITAVGYATSSDGIAWTKQGIVMSPTLAWEKSEVSPNSILVESGVYKLWYHGGGYPSGNQRLGNARIGYATSSDGLAWTKMANPVVDIGAPGSFDDDQAAEPRVLRVGGYRMYYTGHNATSKLNALGVATSTDGVTWTKSAGNPILDTTRWGNFWGGAFFDEGGTWHLWHGVATGSSSALHYMWSTDGLVWNDGPNNPVLSQNTNSMAADYSLVGDSVSGYRDGNSYRILYTGFNANLDALGRFEGICMASVAAVCP